MHRSPSPTRPCLRPLALAAALALGAVVTPVAAQTGAVQVAPAQVAVNGTLLAVSVQAESKRVPDIARLSTGVVTQAAEAEAAMQANAEQMSRVVEAIKAAGIDERDIQTSSVSLHPQYRYAENQPPTITGYEASNTVEITVRDIGQLGEILDALVEVGANQINGPTFDVEDKQAAFDEARLAALDKARARARKYAEALDMRVVRIVSISEGHGFNPPRPVPMMAMARMESAQAETPIAPGEVTMTVDLDVAFELGR